MFDVGPTPEDGTLILLKSSSNIPSSHKSIISSVESTIIIENNSTSVIMENNSVSTAIISGYKKASPLLTPMTSQTCEGLVNSCGWLQLQTFLLKQYLVSVFNENYYNWSTLKSILIQSTLICCLSAHSNRMRLWTRALPHDEARISSVINYCPPSHKLTSRDQWSYQESFQIIRLCHSLLLRPTTKLTSRSLRIICSIYL